MLKKVMLGMMLLLAIMSMTACKADPKGKKDPAELLRAEIITPEVMNLQQEAVIKVKLTQRDQPVTSAGHVQFEVGKVDGEEGTEMIQAKHDKDGVYTVAKMFPENGVYYVQTHISALDQHLMPTKRFVVGEVSAEELKALEDNKPIHDKGHDHHGHH